MTRAELLESAKPILFNTEMTRAILENIKMATRRCVKPKQLIGFRPEKCPNGMPEEFIKEKSMMFLPYSHMEDAELISAIYKSPYDVGDILYVRETWTLEEFYDDEALIKFKAGGELSLDYETEGELYSKLCKFADNKWNPSLFMPKEAARIFLKVTDVRAERLQDITEEGVWDEGFRFKPPCLTRVSADGHCCDLDGPCTSSIKYCDMTMGELFGRELWNSTTKKSDLALYGWDANPWVWVIEFERIKPESEV